MVGDIHLDDHSASVHLCDDLTFPHKEWFLLLLRQGTVDAEKATQKLVRQHPILDGHGNIREQPTKYHYGGCHPSKIEAIKRLIMMMMFYAKCMTRLQECGRLLRPITVSFHSGSSVAIAIIEQ